MTAAEFRKMALALPHAEERAHMGHPDFRVAGKIFATLGYPGPEFAMVKLTPEQQHAYTHAGPQTFVPVKGGWGLKGATNVCLPDANKTAVRSALSDAWCNAAPSAATGGKSGIGRAFNKGKVR